LGLKFSLRLRGCFMTRDQVLELCTLAGMLIDKIPVNPILKNRAGMQHEGMHSKCI